ncbi:MAG TPA: protein kinase [Ktedonobacteraceae bacterium]|nr:protein kinase [Ktedonobacteraceae bacterium]
MPGLEGKTLNHYELRRLVGRGGMADVYAGYDSLLEREVAVKVFKREEEQMLRRFVREAQLMDSLSNPHLVPIYDSGSSLIGDTTWYYIVMPFMQGGTLRARIRRSPLSLTETCIDLGDIADALDYIHSRGIVHRDIKASNVLLDTEGRCFLADFGIARTSTDATQLTSTGNVLGTVDYVAPELFETNRKADAGSDLYSLGVLLFEMVTGRLPFFAENQIALVTMHMNAQPPVPSSIAPQVTPSVDRVILRALAKQPEQRYSSATALADAFCHAVAFGAAAPGDVWEQLDGAMPPIGAYHGAQAISGSDLPALIQSPTGQSAHDGPIVLPPPITGQPRRNMQTPVVSLQASPIPPVTPAPPVSPTRPQPRRDRRAMIVTIMALVVLLLVIVPVVVVAVMYPGNTSPTSPPATSASTQGGTTGATVTSTTAATPTPSPTPNATATAQAQTAATATAQAQATASAIAAVTATARAQASATAGVIATATGGSPTYADTLTNPYISKTQLAQWDGVNGGDSQCVFSSNGYAVKQNISSSNLHACHEAAYQYGNATIKVDVTILKGHSGGLFFRFSNGPFGTYNGYLFEIDSNGNYKLSIFAGNAIQDWTPATALKTGYNVTNTIAVIMNGSTFALYANGAYLTTLTDSSNAFASGNLAFFASATNADTEVVFSNLGIYPLS